MAYSPFYPGGWMDGSGGGTPIEAAALNNVESGLTTADANATTSLANKGKPLALTGATAATRYVGGTASGAPVTGTFAVGDFVIDQTGKEWVCVGSGSPGTWTQVGGGLSYLSGNFFNGVISSSPASYPFGPFTNGTWLVNVIMGLTWTTAVLLDVHVTPAAGMTLTGVTDAQIDIPSSSAYGQAALNFINVVTAGGNVTLNLENAGANGEFWDNAYLGHRQSGYTAVKIA